MYCTGLLRWRRTAWRRRRIMSRLKALVWAGLVLVIGSCAPAVQLSGAPRSEWGGPLVKIAQADKVWTVTGQKQSFTLDQGDLSLSVKSGPTTWSMVASQPGDMIVKAGSEEFPLRLA